MPAPTRQATEARELKGSLVQQRLERGQQFLGERVKVRQGAGGAVVRKLAHGTE
jgi:hypothetical protein